MLEIIKNLFCGRSCGWQEMSNKKASHIKAQRQAIYNILTIKEQS